jgi:hypothetical protein
MTTYIWLNFENLFNSLKNDNGFTVDKNGETPKKGYCVGITPLQFVSVFDLSSNERERFEKICKAFICEFSLFETENCYFGVWYNSENGLTYFDKVKVFNSLSFALKIAFDRFR